MMKYLKNALLSPWGFSRIIRLLLGIVILIQAVQMGDILFGLLGSLFFGQALLNMGCSTAGCGVPMYRSGNNDDKETAFEEIKKDS